MGGAGYVPLSEIESFARIYRIDDIEEFLQYIRAMDAIVVEHFNRKKS